LENAEIYSKTKTTKEIEENLLKKIINLKKLKEISFKLSNINFNEIQKGKNFSVQKISLFLDCNKNIDCNLYNLLDTFTNLRELEILTPKNREKNKIKIIQNKNSKIEKISFEGSDNKNIEIYCGPFEKLKYISFNCVAGVNTNFTYAGVLSDLKDIIPIFAEKCKIIFKSLTYFKFYSGEMNFNEFDNLCKNLDKLPNLKHFSFDCIVKDMNKKYYEAFIKKLLSMKLDVIDLTMRILCEEDDEQEEQEEQEDEEIVNRYSYSEKELKEIYPDMEQDKLYKISKIINSAYN
jgi:hypothetical protein